MADDILESHTARRLRRFSAAVLAALLLAGCAPSPPTAPSAQESASAPTRPAAPEGALPESLRAELQTAVETTMAEYSVPGAAAGVWIPDAGSWTTSVGLADVEQGTPVTADMQWPLRSVTKSYTVTVILQLVDEGLLSLDDTIGQYVDGVRGGDAITLRELANMSSGNADYTNDAFIEAFQSDPSRIFTLDELNGFMLDEPAQFEPGSRRIYTNANTNLLGAVVTSVTGQDFADVVSARILEPLGQTGTQYLVDASSWTASHPLGYVRTDDGQGWEAQPDNLSIYGPAGSMVSTLDDARVWAETLGSGALLSSDSQSARLDGARLEEGPPYDEYALGIGTTDGWWGHNGEGFGFTAAVFHEPVTGSSIVVFMNLSNVVTGEHPADELFRRLAAVLESRS